MDDEEILYTLLVAACSGPSAHEVFVAARIHPQNFPLDANSVLLKVDFSQTPPLTQVLLNAGQQMPDAVDYFSCLARDGDAVLVGSDEDIVRHGSSVDRISLNALEPKPHGIDCAHQVDPHHVVFGTPNGLVVDRVQQTLHVQRIFEDKMHGARVNALHGLGDDFLVAVGEGCLAVRERGLWRTVTPPSPDAFSGVWCCSRNEIYIAGDVLWRWNCADQWTPLPLSGSSRAHDVAAFQGIVHVAGADGVFRLEGDQFVSVGLSDEVTVAKLRVTSAGLIGLGDWGWGGRWLARFDGTSWTAAEIDLSHAYVESGW